MIYETQNKIIWHPYPEEKPFSHKEYFVTVAYKTKPAITKICSYKCGKFSKNDERIVAWTGIPEPYKKEQK